MSIGEKQTERTLQAYVSIISTQNLWVWK